MNLAEHITSLVSFWRKPKPVKALAMDPDGVLQGSGSIRFRIPSEIAPKEQSLSGTAAAAEAIRRSSATKATDPSPALARALSIPCPDPTAEDRERDRHQALGRSMARQERWEDVAAILADHDQARAQTEGGMPLAELICFGARGDVVAAVEHVLVSGKPDKGAPLLDGIEALEEILACMPNDPWIASIVAYTHMDIGWAWRGTGWEAEIPARNKAAFAAHFDRAADILDAFDAKAIDAPLVAAAQCSLAAGIPDRNGRLADRYESLIDLNPANPRAMRAFGAHMLPRWHGSYEQLELQARRNAGRHDDVWGAGGYTWVMFDAISSDAEACANLDLEFFIEGLRDILARSGDQHTVNLLASYCANTMGHVATGHDEADHIRAQIADCAAWIVREHLTELHPMLWAHAARGFDNALRVRCPDRFAASGYADALRIIADLYRKDMRSDRGSMRFSNALPSTA